MRRSIALILGIVLAVPQVQADPPSSQSIADAVDKSLWGDNLNSAIAVTDDAAFLRRVMLDIAGRPATPEEIRTFVTNESTSKRTEKIQELLKSEDYGQNWAHYWRDAIFLRATNMRAGIVRGDFEEWMAAELNRNTSWDKIATQLMTATGEVNGNGQTALIFAHEGTAEEVAAEASRLFLGIQIQCANCHDHPWDSWKRTQFHQFTAFFPRVSVQRKRGSDKVFEFEITAVDQDRSRNPIASRFLLTRVDKNRDSAITEAEAKGTPLARVFSGQAMQFIDKNGDKKLTIEEIMTAEPPERPGRGSVEHYMADLNDPGSEGTKIDPKFFLNNRKVPTGLSDAERRAMVSQFVTSKSNPWFARAIINRVWYEMNGTSFYTPVDDIGPDRECVNEETLKILTDGFIDSNYDLKWLVETIATTRTYQRRSDSSAEGFAKSEPMRLRSDQLYESLCQCLGVSELPLRSTQRGPQGMLQRAGGGRGEFARIFGFDPSTPRDEVTGSIPEALFLMNSPMIARLMSAPGAGSLVSKVSMSSLAEDDVVAELYLTMLGREPSTREQAIAREYLSKTTSFRAGIEDLAWALLNSAEFSSRP